LSLATGGLGALAVVVVYGILATTLGLLAIAGATGFLVGLPWRARAEPANTGSPLTGGSPRSPVAVAVAISVAAMVLGMIGGWAVSLTQGGIAGPLEYIGQTLGLLVLAVPLVAGAAAWLGSRQAT
jgi:hypothetical protein